MPRRERQEERPGEGPEDDDDYAFRSSTTLARDGRSLAPKRGSEDLPATLAPAGGGRLGRRARGCSSGRRGCVLVAVALGGVWRRWGGG